MFDLLSHALLTAEIGLFLGFCFGAALDTPGCGPGCSKTGSRGNNLRIPLFCSDIVQAW